jgi:hypothetical protein
LAATESEFQMAVTRVFPDAAGQYSEPRNRAMADIFISYSKQDQNEARLLAAYLEAAGYSVWWDTSLLSGDKFRSVIMTELGKARVVIVIWTNHSINSDWVQSEAGRAHADRKLIPVKAKGVAYKDIPPPFDNMHIEALGDREKTLGAVIALLAKPQDWQPLLTRLSGRARFELLSWFGIIGAALSLTSMLRSLQLIAEWTRRILDSWISFLQAAWGKLFPTLAGSDAIFLTFISFMLINVITSCRRSPTIGEGEPWYPMLLPLTIILGIFTTGLLQSDLRGSYLSTLYAIDPVPVHLYADYPILNFLSYVAAFALILVPLAVLYFAFQTATSFRISPAAFTARLWRIVMAVGMLLGLNLIWFWLGQPKES